MARTDTLVPDTVPAEVVTTASPPREPLLDTEEIVLTRRNTVARLHLGSVARVAAVFWASIGLLVIGAVLMAWVYLSSAGAVERAESFVMDMTGLENFELMSATMLTGLAVLVALFVVGAVATTIVAAAFYNVLARTMGGVDLTIVEELGRIRIERQQLEGAVETAAHASGAKVAKS